MKSRYTLFATIILLFLVAGCSQGISTPVSNDIYNGINSTGELDSLPVIAFGKHSAIGLFGAFNLDISPDFTSAELTPMRISALGESFIVSGASFFTRTPCPDCLQLDSITVYDADSVILGMSIKHPFPKGNTSEPPTALNRLDLDVFDLAFVLNPVGAAPTTYTQTGLAVFTQLMVNADGYTKELESITANAAAVPYKICYENADNNRFAMGTGFQPFDVILSPGPELRFEIYLTMGYGASATRKERLEPVYFVPEFNRKAAWKVEVTPPDIGDTWTSGDTTTEHDVIIDIYDWNHGATVSGSFPDSYHTGRISASSNIDMVTIEVPGMTNSLVAASTTDTYTNGWDDPMTYTASFANENDLIAGEYTGLVKVTDSRIPADSDEDDFAYGWGFTWDTNIDSSGFTYSAVIDGAGNIYISGDFVGTLDFDPGPGADWHSSASPGNSDAFLKKFDTNGNYLWAITWGAENNEYDYGITIDNSGYVYVIGTFDGTVDFDPGPGTDFHQGYGENDVYLCKFDSDGDFQWARTWGSDYLGDSVSDVAVSDSGGVYVAGVFTGMTDFEPGPFTDIYIANGQEDAYLSFFDTNGNYLGVQVWGGFGEEKVFALDVDNSADVYVLGMFEYTVDFDPGDGNDWHDSIHNLDAPFLCKYEPNGNYIRTKTWGTATGWCAAFGMVFDSADNIYIIGTFDENVDLDPGAGEDYHLSAVESSDIYLTKLNSDGIFNWAKSWGGVVGDSGAAVAVDDSDYIYTTGFFSGGVDFAPGPDVDGHNSVGQSDPYINKFEPDGDFIYAHTWGGGVVDWGSGVALDNSGSIYVTGIFNYAIDLDPTDGEDRHTADGESRFLAKFLTSGVASEGDSDTLVHSPDGIGLQWRYLPEFVTYQTFVATVN